MKQALLMLAGAMLLLGGCAESEEAARLLAEASMPETASTELAETAWEGVYADGTRTVTLEQEADGTLAYCFSEGSRGRMTEVTGGTARSEQLLFSLGGDTLSVVGEGCTGNYAREE